MSENEFHYNRITALHEELAQLYRGKSTDAIRIQGLWARIERLEATQVRLRAREARATA
jgi:hypothetical protein